MRMTRGIGWLALVLAMAGGAQGARAAHISSRLTREDGMNAVSIKGETYTYRDLEAKRALNPARFDRYHPRLGNGLSKGLDGLLAREALNPRRFRFFHPLLAYLMDDVTPDSVAGIGLTGNPDLPPLVLGPPPGPPAPPSPQEIAPAAVPEPASLLMMGAGLAGLGLAARASRRRQGRGPARPQG
jgi:hypothetical protein